VYNDEVFQCLYQTWYLLVLKFLKFVITYDGCFVQGKDSFGKINLPLKKCMDFVKMFAYGVVTNAIDEYCLWESKPMESLKKIVCAIWELLKHVYLTQVNLEHQL
jgi:hypothetical protein